MSIEYYSGPGKAYFNSVGLFPIGLINYVLAQEKNDVVSAMHGRVASTLGGTVGKISLTPFDNWGLLTTLFPVYLGVTSGSGPSTGALLIGQRPHNPFTAGSMGSDMSTVIWNPTMTNKITVKRTAITKHPDIHLGVDRGLYGPIELSALASSTSGTSQVAIGSAAAFHSITESGASDPGGNFATTDFIREPWTGVWGTAAGFGGDSGAALQAEDEWVITSDIKYSALPVQKQIAHYKLDSVQFMAKARLTGPTWSNIEANALTSRALGSRWGDPGNLGSAIDLVLTGAISSKTITLKNCDVMGEGFEFGGTRLGVGEIGFVNQITFTTGAPQPLLIFSA